MKTNKRKLKVFIRFSRLNWKSEVVQILHEGEIECGDFDYQNVLKSLNVGDVSKIGDVMGGVEPFNAVEWKKIFGVDDLPNILKADFIETEPIFGIAKYVFVRRGDRVMKWEFADGRK